MVSKTGINFLRKKNLEWVSHICLIYYAHVVIGESHLVYQNSAIKILKRRYGNYLKQMFE